MAPCRSFIPHPLILCLLLIALCVPQTGYPQARQAQAVGKWRTIDDETGKERSIVELRQVNGELQGRILNIFLRPDEKPDPLCEACDGARKNQPVIGMTFLWGLKPDGNDAWAGGAILDPKNGKIYNAKASLAEGGKALRVRGFIGTPLLGRTQTWLREAE